MPTRPDIAVSGGEDWDINAKTPAQIAADPAAQRLLSLCGKDERPVIPFVEEPASIRAGLLRPYPGEESISKLAV